MSRRSLLGFLILNVLVTFGTVLVIVKVYSGITPQATPRPAAAPLIMMITNTPDPRGTQVVYVVVTATLQPGAPLPNSDTASAPGGTDQATQSANPLGFVPTLDPSLLPPSLDNGSNTSTNGTPGADSSAASGTVSAGTNGNNCQTYTIKQGDTAGKNVTAVNIWVVDPMAPDKIQEAEFPPLQIREILLFPVQDCGLPPHEPPTPNIPPQAMPPPT